MSLEEKTARLAAVDDWNLRGVLRLGEGGRVLARIPFGHVSPSGRLPDTIPRRLESRAK